MVKLVSIIFMFFLMFSSCVFAEDEKEPVRDYLYSEAYFDYLIECASENEESNKKEEILNEEIVNKSNEITAFEFDDAISQSFEPFKLGIEKTGTIEKYSETFEKPQIKVMIPVGEKFNFTYNTVEYINKNYTDGRRIATGVEFEPFKWLNFATGVETNYRVNNHDPLSRKIYFNPSYKVNEFLTISFLNKLNVLNNSSDHDIGLYLSPFKTKAIDFKMFAGMTNEASGAQSQSASFYTNFYFF